MGRQKRDRSLLRRFPTTQRRESRPLHSKPSLVDYATVKLTFPPGIPYTESLVAFMIKKLDRARDAPYTNSLVCKDIADALPLSVLEYWQRSIDDLPRSYDLWTSQNRSVLYTRMLTFKYYMRPGPFVLSPQEIKLLNPANSYAYQQVETTSSPASSTPSKNRGHYFEKSQYGKKSSLSCRQFSTSQDQRA